LAHLEKYRSEGEISGREAVVGDVAGRVAVVYDDLISSGGTMRRAAEILRAAGAGEIHLVATHALFTPEAAPLFASDAVASVVVTDSAAPDRLDPAVTGGRLVVLGLASLLAETIVRLEQGGSISELLEPGS
jgi:ribose-phosphate pyrophosphokinase